MLLRKRIIGIFLIVTTLATIGFWEFWGRENLAYKKILILKENTAKNTLITEGMLAVKRVENPGERALIPQQAEKIAGLETIQYVPGGTELYGEYFQESVFSVGGDTGRFILSIPNQWLKSYPQTLRRGDMAYFYCDGELITSAVVAYARDGSNQEVVSPDDERLQASSVVSLIEVVIDEERAVNLGNLADSGKRFVILYN